MNVAASRKLINFISFIIGLGLSIALTIYFINLGVFKDLNALRGLVGDSIILGPDYFCLHPNPASSYSNHSWRDQYCSWCPDIWPLCWIYL